MLKVKHKPVTSSIAGKCIIINLATINQWHEVNRTRNITTENQVHINLANVNRYTLFEIIIHLKMQEILHVELPVHYNIISVKLFKLIIQYSYCMLLQVNSYTLSVPVFVVTEWVPVIICEPAEGRFDTTGITDAILGRADCDRLRATGWPTKIITITVNMQSNNNRVVKTSVSKRIM